MVDKTDKQIHDFSRDISTCITIEYHTIEASFVINDNFFNTCTLQNILG